MNYNGKVVIKAIGGHSKSSRDAVVLETNDGDFVLRIQGSNAFSDPKLDVLVGKEIEIEGIVHSGVLIISSWKEVSGE